MPRLDILRIRAFRDLWLGQAISQVGDSLYFVIFMFMVKRLTGSTPMVGYVDAAAALPFLLLGPIAGVLADRIDRKRLMVLSDVSSGAVLLLFAGVVCLWPSPPTWTLLAVPFLLSCLRAIFLPSKNAAIPSLVPKDRLMEANALSATTQNMMPLIGLAISGSLLGVFFALFERYFFATAVLLNACSFLISAAYVRRLPALRPDATEGAATHPWADFLEGLRFLRSRSVLLALLGLSVAMSLMVSPFFVVYVHSNQEWFGGLPQTLAWFEFSFFLGMILGSMAVGRLDVRRPGLGYVFGTLFVGLAVAGMAFVRTVPGFVAMNLAAGLAIPFAQIPVAVYLQATVPSGFLGRVNSVLSTLSVGVMPIGMAAGGLLVESAGIVNAFLAMGFGMGVVALVGLLHQPFRSSLIPRTA
ncbi:MAG: MFS transporter [Fimbriimonadaceae bacterium]|nr:MFS transporter [Chthonomonadaceae bacterium]MCO5295738.1 MFS transporter [Fimbriimonadaceae bacterium]